MKRTKLCIIIITLSTWLLCGCQKEALSLTTDTTVTMQDITTTQVSEETVSKVKEISDYTDNTIKIKDTFLVDKNKTFDVVVGVAEFGHIYKDVKELGQKAKNVVVGEVVDIFYSDTDAIAKTYYSFAVSEVLKGKSIEKESIITIVDYQGYCRMENFIERYGSKELKDYDEKIADITYRVYTVSGEPLVKAGDKYVLFLDNKQSDEIGDGYYLTIGAFMGKYVEGGSGYYSRYSPEELFYAKKNETTGEVYYESPLTLDEIRERIQ